MHLILIMYCIYIYHRLYIGYMCMYIATSMYKYNHVTLYKRSWWFWGQRHPSTWYSCFRVSKTGCVLHLPHLGSSHRLRVNWSFRSFWFFKYVARMMTNDSETSSCIMRWKHHQVWKRFKNQHFQFLSRQNIRGYIPALSIPKWWIEQNKF